MFKKCSTPDKSSVISRMEFFSNSFFTVFQHFLWKSASMPGLIVLAFCLLTLMACSGHKAVQKSNIASVSESALLSSGPDEVKKRLGEPRSVSKTVDNHIFWVYSPAWKLMPNDKGTVYVEFENDRVIRVFRIR